MKTNRLRNGIGGLALALSTSCVNQDLCEEQFEGSYTNPVTGVNQVATYGVQKDSLGTPLEIVASVRDTIYREDADGRATDVISQIYFKEIARFEGATAQSLYTKLVPKVFESYEAKRK